MADLAEKKNALVVKRNAASSKQGSWFSSDVADSTQEEDEEMTNLTLMGRRLEGKKREVAMLFFSMHSTQAFFKEVRSNCIGGRSSQS